MPRLRKDLASFEDLTDGLNENFCKICGNTDRASLGKDDRQA